MKCQGVRCRDKKRDLGPPVFIVDTVPHCATCFEAWMEKSDTVFDEHKIHRLEAPDKDFELHKGKSHGIRREPVPA